ncbi:MAG: hypothetical protein CMH26_03550 [Micavibrio sp.]|nr:hypothetical protein [Micavibrio sp.]|tara:strand:- start:530 stop:1063 length:534 start_codon:yes stop_codon:yes gene_type:complete
MQVFETTSGDEIVIGDQAKIQIGVHEQNNKPRFITTSKLPIYREEIRDKIFSKHGALAKEFNAQQEEEGRLVLNRYFGERFFIGSYEKPIIITHLKTTKEEQQKGIIKVGVETCGELKIEHNKGNFPQRTHSHTPQTERVASLSTPFSKNRANEQPKKPTAIVVKPRKRKLELPGNE